MHKKVINGLIFFVLPILLMVFLSFSIDKKVKGNITPNKPEKLKYCNNLSYEKNLNLHPSNFYSNINLEIVFDSERSWKKKLLNNLIKSEQNKIDSDGWRNFSSKSKREKGLVIVEIPEKINCKILARIRDHGDLLDQRDGSLLPSLNIHLDNGHLFGISKFILFLPNARNGDNEIFASNLFRELGVLSPRTSYINVKYGKTIKKFIFQEKIQKELLEANSLREGPILEGDERFAFWDKRHKQNLSKNKIVNSTWSKKNNSSYHVAESSISLLNYLMQTHDTENIVTDNLDYYTLGKKIFKKNYFENLDIFDSMSIAMGSDHTMPRNERRFYFDPLFKKYHPIYYDGMFKVLNNNGLNPYTDKADEMITPSVKDGAKKSLRLLSSLDIKEFNKKLNQGGVNISLLKTNEKIEKIKKDLVKINNYDDNRVFKIKINNERNPHVEINENYDQKLKRKLIFYSDDYKDYLKCNIFGKECKKINLSKKERLKLINQELKDKDGNNLIFIGKKKIGKANENWIYQNYFEEVEFNDLENDVKIIRFGNPSLNINYENRLINIIKNGENDKIVFFNGILKNWKIEMVDLTNLKKAESLGADKNNLTGCLNFYDMKIENLELNFANSKCEDAINFVRVSGSVKKMKIENSSFDAIDADFSSITFNNTIIMKSDNDCLDFSFGIYEVKDSLINFCGDKAISVGEMSKVKIYNVNISNSDSGIVSKDFAVVNVAKSKISKTNYCFQAYNKKSEFSGGRLESINSTCAYDYKLAQVDLSSKIILDGKNYLDTNWINKDSGGEYNGI